MPKLMLKPSSSQGTSAFRVTNLLVEYRGKSVKFEQLHQKLKLGDGEAGEGTPVETVLIQPHDNNALLQVGYEL